MYIQRGIKLFANTILYFIFPIVLLPRNGRMVFYPFCCGILCFFYSLLFPKGSTQSRIPKTSIIEILLLKTEFFFELLIRAIVNYFTTYFLCRWVYIFLNELFIYFYFIDSLSLSLDEIETYRDTSNQHFRSPGEKRTLIRFYFSTLNLLLTFNTELLFSGVSTSIRSVQVWLTSSLSVVDF